MACTAGKRASKKRTDLNGSWVLQSIDGEKDTDKIYNAERIPELTFEISKLAVTGNNGCNRLSGKYTFPQQDQIDFGPLITTKMACPGIGEGETIFMQAIEKVNAFNLENETLSLLDGKKEIMRFTRKK